ncbi:unnamed protein product [Zymoseptoria tritici ST99CH_1E4]|uniref:Uncharacterized protein n=1 Tax=Zymoseptoria tritici ST99CH_1E4 TaxID=1276532 RepID=A0A2H1H9X7_ZYMTR|nr:unnamed protein product [Zymoseptoria tritici ST99CH_1E4]
MTEWVGKRYGLDGPGHGPGPAELPAQQPPNFKQFHIDSIPFSIATKLDYTKARPQITLSLTSHACGNIGAIFPRQLNEFYDDLGWDRGGDVPERERRNEKNMHVGEEEDEDQKGEGAEEKGSRDDKEEDDEDDEEDAMISQIFKERSARKMRENVLPEGRKWIVSLPSRSPPDPGEGRAGSNLHPSPTGLLQASPIAQYLLRQTLRPPRQNGTIP